MNLAPVLITRQQYDEAISKLPEVRTYPDQTVEVEVDAGSLLSALRFRSHPGTEAWPMLVQFSKVQTSEVYGLEKGVTCWKLADYYEII